MSKINKEHIVGVGQDMLDEMKSHECWGISNTPPLTTKIKTNKY